MDDQSPPPSPRLPALIAGFAAIYLIWGSTFLGIKFAVETLPPFVMAGFRFLFPGLGLFFWLHRGKADWPTGRQWLVAVFTGALLLLGGNGLVTWGQQTVHSGRAALIIATTPMWMVLLGWFFYGGARPSLRVILGMLAGFVGAVLLIKAPAGDAPAGSLLGFLAILAAPMVWALGSHETRRSRPSEDPMITSAMQMIAGGILMLLVGTLLGEWGQMANRTVSLRSVVAFCYLSVFGSLVGFSTYAWLLRVASPTAVVTYAYVNPLVAVMLGWLFAGEMLGSEVVLSAALIIGAVIVITLPPLSRARPLVPVTEEAVEVPSPENDRPVDHQARKSLSPACRDGYTREGRAGCSAPPAKCGSGK